MRRTEKSTVWQMNERILHGILGMADEAGELISVVKSALYYNKEIDLINIKEELGDMWWYYCLELDEIAVLEHKTPSEVFEEIFAMNKAKLKTRYPNKYSDEKALNRDLDKERKALETQTEQI